LGDEQVLGCHNRRVRKLDLIKAWLLITLLTLSANGAVKANIASGPQNFGLKVHQEKSIAKPLMRQGKSQVSTMAASGIFIEEDKETGLLYAKNRMYDPETGRFLSEDAWEGDNRIAPSLHRYLYVYQNPTVYVDRDGNQAQLANETTKVVVKSVAPKVTTFVTSQVAANTAAAAGTRSLLWWLGPVGVAIQGMWPAATDEQMMANVKEFGQSREGQSFSEQTTEYEESRRERERFAEANPNTLDVRSGLAPPLGSSTGGGEIDVMKEADNKVTVDTKLTGKQEWYRESLNDRINLRGAQGFEDGASTFTQSRYLNNGQGVTGGPSGTWVVPRYQADKLVNRSTSINDVERALGTGDLSLGKSATRIDIRNPQDKGLRMPTAQEGNEVVTQIHGCSAISLNL
jgi:RHS repeat-associated protein